MVIETALDGMKNRDVSRSGGFHVVDPIFVHHEGGTPFLLKSYKRKVPIFKDRTSPNLNLLSLLIQILIVSPGAACVP